jgi:hypothetical protein
MTDDQAPHDWRFLLDIFYEIGRLDHPLYRALAHDDYPREYRLLAIESVLRSGKLPVQGCRHTSLGLEAPEPIEMKIDAETEIDITLNEITLRHGYVIPGDDGVEIARFKRVRADLASVEQCLRESILQADHVVDEPTAASDETQDDVEAECREIKAAQGEASEPTGDNPAPGKSSFDEVSVPRKRSRPPIESAQLAIKELYPGDIPDQATVPNALLFRKVHAKIKEAGRPVVSDDTILRATGRRK